MPLDTNIALQAKLPQIDGPLDTYTKGVSLQNLMNQNKIQGIQAQQAQMGFDEDQAFKEALRGSVDPSNPDMRQLMQASPTKAIALQKSLIDQQKTQMDNAKTQAETQKMNLDFTNQAARDLASNPSDENIKAWAGLAVRNGVMDMNHANALINHVSGLPPLERSQVFAGMGANAEQKLKQLTPDLKPVNLEGVTKFVDQNSNTNPGLSGQVLQHTPSASAVLSSNTSMRNTDVSAATSRDNSIRTDARQRETNGIMEGGQLAPFIEQNAQSIASGHLPPITGIGLRSPTGARTMARVMEINPNFDGGDFAAKSAAIKSFSTGKDGQSIQSANTALNHLDTLGQLAEAQKNGDIRLFNQIANKFATQTGGAAPTNLQGAITMVGPEISKAVIGAGGGVTDREHVNAALKVISDGGPAQATGQIATMKDLFAGRLNEAQRTYERTTKRKDFADTFLSPSAKSILESRTSGGSKSTAQNSSPNVNSKGWQLHIDANGNKAYVSPDGKSFEEVK